MKGNPNPRSDTKYFAPCEKRSQRWCKRWGKYGEWIPQGRELCNGCHIVKPVMILTVQGQRRIIRNILDWTGSEFRAIYKGMEIYCFFDDESHGGFGNGYYMMVTNVENGIKDVDGWAETGEMDIRKVVAEAIEGAMI